MAPDPDHRDRFDEAAKWHAVCMLAALTASIALGRSEPLSVAGVLGLATVGAILWRADRPKLALPTLVTAFRIAITACLGVLGVTLSGREIVVGVLVVFSLDGLDGFLARRLGAVSRLGAQLDNEGDAFLVAVVCVLSWLVVPLGAWILVAGFLRYLYVLTVMFFPSRGHAPPSRLATRAFGISLVGFLIGLSNLGVVSRVAPLLSTLLLLWSFSRSFYWSLRKA